MLARHPPLAPASILYSIHTTPPKGEPSDALDIGLLFPGKRNPLIPSKGEVRPFSDDNNASSREGGLFAPIFPKS